MRRWGISRQETEEGRGSWHSHPGEQRRWSISRHKTEERRGSWHSHPGEQRRWGISRHKTEERRGSWHSHPGEQRRWGISRHKTEERRGSWHSQTGEQRRWGISRHKTEEGAAGTHKLESRGGGVSAGMKQWEGQLALTNWRCTTTPYQDAVSTHLILYQNSPIYVGMEKDMSLLFYPYLFHCPQNMEVYCIGM